jgi:hypothetical protein
LKSACDWTVEPQGKSLLCARLSPGFVRGDEAAFYSVMNQGDLVWIRVASGEVPLMLGALHQRSDRWESGDRACAVALGGAIVELGLADGRIRMADGTVVVSATKAISLSSEKSDVSGALSVKGVIDGEAGANFKKDVQVG